MLLLLLLPPLLLKLFSLRHCSYFLDGLSYQEMKNITLAPVQFLPTNEEREREREYKWHITQSNKQTILAKQTHETKLDTVRTEVFRVI